VNGDEADALFALPPEAFTAARDALAKRLRADGDREGAARVRALRRPTVSAWAVNRLAREAPGEVAPLLAAGADLAAAQAQALSGGGGSALRQAGARRRDLVARLTDLALDLLRADGRAPDPHRGAIATTLEAATVDQEAADAVRAGRLTRDLSTPSGFGELPTLTLVPPPPPDDPPPPPGGPAAAPPAAPASEDPGRTAEQEAADAEADAGSVAAPAAGAVQEEAAERARSVAAARRAEEAAGVARRRADEAAAEAARRDREVADARAAVEAAEEALDASRRAARQARRAAEDAESAARDAESAAFRAVRAASD